MLTDNSGLHGSVSNREDSKSDNQAVCYSCEVCKGSNNLTKLEYDEHIWSLLHHINLEKLNKGMKHDCELCGVEFGNLKEYGLHLNSHEHKQLEDKKRGAFKTMRKADDVPSSFEFPFSRQDDPHASSGKKPWSKCGIDIISSSRNSSKLNNVLQKSFSQTKHHNSSIYPYNNHKQQRKNNGRTMKNRERSNDNINDRHHPNEKRFNSSGKRHHSNFQRAESRQISDNYGSNNYFTGGYNYYLGNYDGNLNEVDYNFGNRQWWPSSPQPRHHNYYSQNDINSVWASGGRPNTSVQSQLNHEALRGGELNSPRSDEIAKEPSGKSLRAVSQPDPSEIKNRTCIDGVKILDDQDTSKSCILFDNATRPTSKSASKDYVAEFSGPWKGVDNDQLTADGSVERNKLGRKKEFKKTSTDCAKRLKKSGSVKNVCVPAANENRNDFLDLCQISKLINGPLSRKQQQLLESVVKSYHRSQRKNRIPSEVDVIRQLEDIRDLNAMTKVELDELPDEILCQISDIVNCPSSKFASVLLAGHSSVNGIFSSDVRELSDSDSGHISCDDVGIPSTTSRPNVISGYKSNAGDVTTTVRSSCDQRKSDFPKDITRVYSNSAPSSSQSASTENSRAPAAATRVETSENGRKNLAGESSNSCQRDANSTASSLHKSTSSGAKSSSTVVGGGCPVERLDADSSSTQNSSRLEMSLGNNLEQRSESSEALPRCQDKPGSHRADYTAGGMIHSINGLSAFIDPLKDLESQELKINSSLNEVRKNIQYFSSKLEELRQHEFQLVSELMYTQRKMHQHIFNFGKSIGSMNHCCSSSNKRDDDTLDPSNNTSASKKVNSSNVSIGNNVGVKTRVEDKTSNAPSVSMLSSIKEEPRDESYESNSTGIDNVTNNNEPTDDTNQNVRKFNSVIVNNGSNSSVKIQYVGAMNSAELAALSANPRHVLNLPQFSSSLGFAANNPN